MIRIYKFYPNQRIHESTNAIRIFVDSPLHSLIRIL